MRSLCPNCPCQPAQPAPMIWRGTEGSITRQAIGQAQFSVRHVPTACSRSRLETSGPLPWILWSTLPESRGKKEQPLQPNSARILFMRWLYYNYTKTWLHICQKQHCNIMACCCFDVPVLASSTAKIDIYIVWFGRLPIHLVTPSQTRLCVVQLSHE